MDIKEKLRLLDRLPYQNLSHDRIEAIHDRAIERAINGVYLESPYGSCFVRRKHFPLDFVHGQVPLFSYLEKSASHLCLVGKDRTFAGIDVRRTVFIDTESTGISGGMGTCAFLVGVGYFLDDGFRIEQFFMNDFDEEQALLFLVNRLLETQRLAITYNGKCFDIPLLVSRNVLHRLTAPFDDLAHLDLLFAVRRLWRHRLPDCALTTVERDILQESRIGDIPGHLIPGLYFDYLRTRDPNPLKAVFYHNQQDILTLVALAVRACEIFEDPIGRATTSHDVLSVGRVYEAVEEFHRSSELYEQFLLRQARPGRQKELLIRMALNYKKQREWEKAREVWQRMLATETFHPLPYIELAKYYEHKLKDPATAHSLVEKALKELQLLEELRIVDKWREYKDDLLYRKERLMRKTRPAAPARKRS